MSNMVDLHTHTTKSDGEFSPNELLIMAEEKGIKYLSITDHESVEAYYEMDYSLYGGVVIPGIELRTSCHGIAIELLMYGFNINKMRDMLAKYHYKNTKEIDEYMLKLSFDQYRKRNIKISESFIEEYDIEKFQRLSAYIKFAVEKFPENQYLLDDISKGRSFFRTCMTNPESPLFIDLTDVFPTIQELLKLKKKVNGFISIPHIFSYGGYSKKILNTLLDEYPEIDAIEVYHSSFSQNQIAYLLNVAKNRNKYITGGTDFHGKVRPAVKLGSGENNNIDIPCEFVEDWIRILPNIINAKKMK